MDDWTTGRISSHLKQVGNLISSEEAERAVWQTNRHLVVVIRRNFDLHTITYGVQNENDDEL